MKRLFQILFLINSIAYGQFSPIVGEDGCIAIPSDSPLFVAWATEGEAVRGWMNIADTTLGKASFGEIDFCYGEPNPAVLSLGDGGMATFVFEPALFDGIGYDFAVFENAFDAYFLELAFVEVSSDGENFFRFESQSLSPVETQLGAFDLLATEQIHNLAGKYPAQWGTPFDLSELALNDSLNINAITHIRVIDVVGSVNPLYASYDANGRVINDPWPTAFESGGFDLDAIGVIHQNQLSIDEYTDLLIYPNPVGIDGILHLKGEGNIENIKIIDRLGRVQLVENTTEIYLSQFVENSGLYILEYQAGGKPKRQKLIINE